MSTEQERIEQIISTLKKRQEENRLNYYKPYRFQKNFHETGVEANQRLLMAANRVGKSFVGAMEMAIHLTGLYPEWWVGRRYKEPIRAWVCGASNETTRDICQRELFGQPDNPRDKGKGSIPKHLIGETTRKPGVPNAHSSVLVKHSSGGWSRVAFKAYEMGAEKFMGESIDLVWLDEEPPQDIYSQCVTRTLDRQGMVYMTFTPESGVTEVVQSFTTDLKPGQALVTAGWEDADHLTDKMKEQILQALPPHEREMRSKGIPTIGSGLVFPILEDNLTCEPFTIPSHYPRIAGLDFGYDHPTAVVWVAWDRDEDIVYIYDVYRMSKQTPDYHATHINEREGSHYIPIAFPHDGYQHDKGSGVTLAEHYRQANVNMLPFHFENPPALGEKKGGNSVEAGIMDMLSRMEQGRFKVFNTCYEWFEEYRLYHRKDGKIVKLKDDLMSATRYAVMSLRHSTTETSKWNSKGRLGPKVAIV
jgi:phage terminase large subunit-like protein